MANNTASKYSLHGSTGPEHWVFLVPGSRVTFVFKVFYSINQRNEFFTLCVQFFCWVSKQECQFFHQLEKLRDQAKIFFETDFLFFIKNLIWHENVQMLIKTNHDIVTSTRKNFDPATEKVRPERGVDAPSNTWGLREHWTVPLKGSGRPESGRPGGGEVGQAYLPSYIFWFWFGLGFQFFLEMNCLEANYHIQRGLRPSS